MKASNKKMFVGSLWLSLMLALTVSGCCVHEFPEDKRERVDLVMHLNFDTEMPIYEQIDYTSSATQHTQSPQSLQPHSIRYQIKAYRMDDQRIENRQEDTTIVFTRDYTEDLNYTVNLSMYEGDYTFQVWVDYVDAGSKKDKYYNTSNFEEIILNSEQPHYGSTDYRDAFRGYAATQVINTQYYSNVSQQSTLNEVTVMMQRPMGKYKFISTDVEAFVMKLREQMGMEDPPHDGSLMNDIDFNEFRVVFRYNGFMPCSFNMFTDKPADSWTGIWFESKMMLENELEMNLGFDYLFVNGSETTASISLEVYDKNGELLSATTPKDVPVVRSKLTIVKGDFLTSIATGGIGINPGYDGNDYNVEL